LKFQKTDEQLRSNRVAVMQHFIDGEFNFLRERCCMIPLSDGISVTPHFAEIVTFMELRELVRDDLAGKRVHIPTHKRGVTVPYGDVRKNYPQIAQYYQSEFLAQRISRAVGTRVMPTPLDDQSSCSLLVYERPGDRIGWHYDHNFYNGRHFTALLALVNEHFVEHRLSSAELQIEGEDGPLTVPTPPNTLVLFEGEFVRHAVTPLGKDERRVILSMTFCTDPTATPFHDLQRRFKDIAYLGVSALWT